MRGLHKTTNRGRIHFCIRFFSALNILNNKTNLKSESVETVIPYMVTYEVPLLPSPIMKGRRSSPNSHNNPKLIKCES